MPRALLAGGGMAMYADLLAARGFEVRPARTVTPRSLAGVDLIILDASLRDYPSALPEQCSGLPKIVISTEAASKKPGLGAWMDASFSYLVQSPSAPELVRLAHRVMREHALVADNERLRADSALISREIGMIDEINKFVSASHDLNSALSLIAWRIKSIVKARGWAVFILPEEAGLPVGRLSSRNPKRPVKLAKTAGADGIAGWSARKGSAVLVRDTARDGKRFQPRIDGTGSKKVSSLMCAPIQNRDRTVAVLEMLDRADDAPFDEADFTLFKRLVADVSFAVEQLTLHQRLEELVVTDDLTSLFNTRYLNRSIETEIARSTRYSTSVALIFMDLDHFKDINDNHGHLVGSKVLVEVGNLLMQLLRNIDIVARYGGDEFVIVLPQTTLHNAMIIAERIRKSVETHIFMSDECLRLRITASLGVASYPETSKSKEALLRLADEAMYSVKRNTRNAVYAII